VKIFLLIGLFSVLSLANTNWLEYCFARIHTFLNDSVEYKYVQGDVHPHYTVMRLDENLNNYPQVLHIQFDKTCTFIFPAVFSFVLLMGLTWQRMIDAFAIFLLAFVLNIGRFVLTDFLIRSDVPLYIAHTGPMWLCYSVLLYVGMWGFLTRNKNQNQNQRVDNCSQKHMKIL